MRALLQTIAALALLSACGGPVGLAAAVPQGPAPELTAVATTTGAVPGPDPTDSRVAVLTAEDLRIPTDPACKLTAAKLEQAPALHLRADGLPFARVPSMTNARMHVTADPVGTGLFLELEVGPVALAGVVLASETSVYAKEPLVLGGIFLPRGDVGMRITGASKDRLLLEAARTPFSLRELTTRLRSDVPCSAASMLATKLDVRGSLGRAIGRSHLLGDAVPLSLTANGEPVAMLAPSDRVVEIVERAERAARVVWRISEGFVSGWVPSAHLGPDPKSGGSGSGRLGGRHQSGGHSANEKRICARDVALGVTVGEDAMFVGRIRAHTTFDVFANSWGGDHVNVQIHAADIRLLNGAQLFVRQGDIADCPNPPGVKQRGQVVTSFIQRR